MIYQTEKAKYIRIWDHPEYRAFSPAEQIVGIANSMFQKYGKIGSLIDFGCGTGRAAKRFSEIGYDVTMIDFAPNAVEVSGLTFKEYCLWLLPSEIKSDHGICIDVMEHIPTDKVSETLDCIHKSVTDLMFFQIALTPDSCGSLIGEKLHLTLWDSTQWKRELNSRWTEVYAESNGYNLIYLGRSTHIDPIAGPSSAI